MRYTAKEFSEEVVRAMRAGDRAIQETCSAVQNALASQNLFEGFEPEFGQLEFHLHRSPQLAIKVFCMNERTPVSPPHDHGPFWGVYGVYKGALGWAEFKVTEEGEESANVEEVGSTLLEQGTIRTILPTKVHAVWSPEESIILTVYNGDLNSVPRRIFDPRKSLVVRERSDWEERLGKGEGREYKVG
jgi:predicted metal-dependent enzyme (double-stranded beta helix superfamily)